MPANRHHLAPLNSQANPVMSVACSFVQLDNYNPKYLPIFSRDVLKRIAAGDESWDEMVPPQAAESIRRRGFFGYKKR
jgi:hypothetical protein